jgi:hypothetical protein
MAMTRNQTQIQFSSSNSVVISTASGTATSDAFTFDATDVAASLTVKASTAGTPATGDVIDVYIEFTTGDVSGSAGASTYDTPEHALYLGRIDNFATDVPGEQPAQKTWDIPVSAVGFKVFIQGSANANTRNQTINARVNTQRAA